MRVIIFLSFCASLFSSCKITSYYNTPNDVFRERSIVYLADGSSEEGMLTVNLETGRTENDYVVLNSGGVDKKIKLKDIDHYTIGKNSFHLKKVDVELNDFYRLLFVKRLTPDDSRVHLYELHQQKSKSSDGRDYYYYFVSFPQYDRLVAQNISGKTFQPKFDEKVSAMFLNCMPVATKIRNKQNGYYLQLYTLSDKKKADVWLRIIREYQDCK